MMKRTMLQVAFLPLCLTSLAAQGERNAALETEHYAILAMDGASAALLAEAVEQRFAFYNNLFHYEPKGAAFPLKVRAFSDGAAYENYVRAKASGTGTDGALPAAVYLHYAQPGKRELCVLWGGPEAAAPEDFDAALSHQAFVQFFRAFIPNPPLWMREGFALYFSGLRFDAAAAAPENGVEGALVFEENLAWFDYAKSLADSGPSLPSVLAAESPPPPDADFQAVSWALVSFLLSGGGDYYRTLTDCFTVLSPGASAHKNTLAAAERISRWTDPLALEQDYRARLDSRQGYAALIDSGRAALDAGDTKAAEADFLAARNQRPSHYAAHYYLGLLRYGEGRYEEAAAHYAESLRKGADEDAVCYALGLNAARAGWNGEAADWLEQAAAGPGRYGEKAGELLKGLRQGQPGHSSNREQEPGRE